jgi:ribonucleoside-diphosphate reductase subunit M2
VGSIHAVSTLTYRFVCHLQPSTLTIKSAMPANALDDHQRWSLYPIRHQQLWDMYKNHVACFWTVDELDLSRDYVDFTDKMNANERLFIERILAFFAFGDGLVMENLVTRFFAEIRVAEARQFYAVQAFSEAIHAETYSLLLQTLVRDEARRRQLFDLAQADPALVAKAQWMMRYMDSALPLSDRLVAYACVEGVFFSSSFACIFWLKRRNLCEGLCKSNEFISRDEGLHRDFAVALYHLGIKSDRTKEIVQHAVEVETRFITDALDMALLGLSADDMCMYIRFVADNLLLALGEDKVFNVTNPLDFMDLISIQRKTNFFESRVSEYAKSRIGTSEQDCTFSLQEEF